MSYTLGVLALNNWKYTSAFLASIDVDMDVLLIDNGSTDGTAELAKQLIIPGTGRPPRVVRMEENIGVAAGWNAIFKNSDSKTVLIANNDIALHPGSIKKLIRAHHRLGAAVTSGCRVPGPFPFNWGWGSDYGFFALDRDIWQSYPFDEDFWPAYFEDCDHTIRLHRAGLETCRTHEAIFDVLEGGSRTMNEGITDARTHKVMHQGIQRNSNLFRQKYGTAMSQEAIDKVTEAAGATPLKTLLKYVQEAGSYRPPRFGGCDDFYQHVTTLHKLAWQYDHITEMGVRSGISTTAILSGQPKTHIAYDIVEHPQVKMIAAVHNKTAFDFRLKDVLTIDIEPTDLLFIDTIHTYTQLRAEFERHAHQVRHRIVLHDTSTYGPHGEDGSRPGLMAAVNDLVRTGAFHIEHHYLNNNGLMVLKRGRAPEKPTGPTLPNIESAITRKIQRIARPGQHPGRRHPLDK